MAERLRVYSHPSSLDHVTGPAHPESPQRLQAVLGALRRAPFTDRIEWRDAAPAEDTALQRAHPPDYLATLRAVATRGGGALDPDTTMAPGSWSAAVHAAGAVIGAARSALEGVPAFAAVRPPGHHATATRAMGFCLLSNAAIAALTAVDEWDLTRVLIVDWDVHHGNGTQAVVERDPRIRYVSLHQWPLYPGTGRSEERGVGNVFNVPRPPGLQRAEYVAALDDAVAAATDGWVPELILLSAGFDAMAGDPLAGFTLEPEDYAEWVSRWRQLGAPIASLLEGGYVPDRIALAAVAHLQAMG